MIRIIHTIVVFLYSVLISAAAILALVLVPPVGLLLLLTLRRHLMRESKCMASGHII